MKRYPGVLGVIPARFGSTRLPGKPLATVNGKPMVQWVYEAAASVLPRVLVATDHKRVLDAVKRFGGQAMMTPSSCASGTDRMAWVARRKKASTYINIQGDEPLIHGQSILAALDLSVKRKGIATVVTDLKNREKANPDVVKVVVGDESRALYFSRSTIPFQRERKSGAKFFKHIGLYVYPKKELLRFVGLKPTLLENVEKLEQLRALYYGMPIYVAYTKHDSFGVDVPSDLVKAEKFLRRNYKGGLV